MAVTEVKTTARLRDTPGTLPAARAAAGDEPAFFSRQIAEARRFFLKLNPPWSSGFHVVCGGSEHCAADYRVARDDFPYVAVEFVVQGKGWVVLNGKTHALIPGAVFAYGPGVAHEMRCLPEAPMTKYFVDFAGPQVIRQLVRPAPRPGEIVQSSAPEHIAEIFDQLIDAGKRESAFRERLCRTIGEYLVLAIAESAVPLGTMGTVAFETFQRCRQWIDRNYRQCESLERIASECGVAEGYLCRLFKRYAHQSPWQHVLRLKMRDAAQRLQTTEARVGEVAYEFGFSDPFQFSRTFRQVFGLSPRAFMRLHRRSV